MILKKTQIFFGAIFILFALPEIAHADPVVVSCTGGGSFTISDNIVSLGASCLGTANIPDGVSTINESAFEGSSLSQVVVPNSVTTIVKYAFYGAGNLQRVNLGTGIQSIETDVFNGASTLAEIYFKGSVPMIAAQTFNGIPAEVNGYVIFENFSSFGVAEGALWNGLVLRSYGAPTQDSETPEAKNARLAAAAAAKREAEKRLARAKLSRKIDNPKEVSVELFSNADISGVNSSNITAVQAEIFALPDTERSNIDQIIKVARKFEVVGLIASNQAGRVYPNMYVEIGLIPEASKIKTSLVVAIRALPESGRSGYTEIKAAIDAKTAELKSRNDRLKSTIARIKSHNAS